MFRRKCLKNIFIVLELKKGMFWTFKIIAIFKKKKTNST
jgi:hypothetical protein